MRGETTARVKRIVATIVLIIGIIVSFLQFISDNARRISSQNEDYLYDLTTQRAISVDNLIAENLSFIKSTAYLYSSSLDSPFADVASIRDYEQNAVFDMLRFVDATGDNYTSLGVQSNLADRPYFQDGMRGNTGITFVQQSRVTGQRQVGFYSPVYFEGDIIGVMVGFYGEEYVEKLLEFGLFGHDGQGWLVDREGTVIGTTVETDAENFFDVLLEDGGSESEVRALSQAFLGRESSSFSFSDAGVQTTAYAVPLAQVDWILVRSFPPAATGQMVGNANHEGVMLLVKLIALFGVYLVIYALDVLVERRRTADANRSANDISHGVQTLFNAFVRLDLDAYTYEYIGGAPTYEGMPLAGSYGDIADGILALIPAGEDEHRAEVARYFSRDNMRTNLADADIVSLRVHAPSGAGEWHTFNFMVLNRNEDGSPHQLLVTLQDVTELHEREVREQRLLEKALDAAEDASRAKTEFLFNMSHDLRTPMNAIIGYTELAQKPGVSLDEMRDFVRKIDSSSEHLLALINDILEMSRIESGKMTLAPEETDLSRVVDEARSLFVTQMREKGIDFVVDACSSVGDRWVLCDRNRLNRVLLNLISNAYKFTPEGGRVTVTLEQRGRDDATNAGDYVLRVKDSGIGMSPDFVDRLFTPFERERTSTVSRTQGTGLGLSITKKIVDLMGGTIEVQTEQGKGTEFVVRLTLPLAEDHAEETVQAPAADASQSDDFTGVRILLVEDQAINMEIATMLLTSYGFVVDTAVNGQEALDKVAASSPGDYDVVLMDVQMPVMDGYAATRAIRALADERLAAVPIVAMTANAFAEDVQAAREAGMDGHIAKPINVDKMLATLREVLRG